MSIIILSQSRNTHCLHIVTVIQLLSSCSFLSLTSCCCFTTHSRPAGSMSLFCFKSSFSRLRLFIATTILLLLHVMKTVVFLYIYTLLAFQNNFFKQWRRIIISHEMNCQGFHQFSSFITLFFCFKLLLNVHIIHSRLWESNCSLSLWRVVRGSKLMLLVSLIHGLFIT